MQEELLLLLRNQQRELAELRQNQQELLQRLTGHMDAVQSSVMAHVEHVLLTQQEQERILPVKTKGIANFFNFKVFGISMIFFTSMFWHTKIKLHALE